MQGGGQFVALAKLGKMQVPLRVSYNASHGVSISLYGAKKLLRAGLHNGLTWLQGWGKLGPCRRCSQESPGGTGKGLPSPGRGGSLRGGAKRS